MITKPIIATDRLQLREAFENDAAFFHTLMNDTDWLAFIGDRDIADHAAATRYIRDHTRAAYLAHDMGMWVVTLGGVAIGLCGLNKREHLTDVDLGFAFLPEYRREGFALEAAEAVIEYGRNNLRLSTLIAITMPVNVASQRLLERLGFTYRRLLDPDSKGERLMLYHLKL